MKNKLILLLVFLLSASFLHAEVRTWNMKKGDPVEAEFVKVQFTSVYLKDADGKEVKVSLSTLSTEDQKVAKALQMEASKARMKAKSSGSFVSSSGTLTDEEVAALKTTYMDEAHNREYKFSARLSTQSLDKKKQASTIKKYASSGKVPIRLTCDFLEYSTKGSKKSVKRMSGTGYFYIKDSEGNIVTKKSMSLSKLCPS